MALVIRCKDMGENCDWVGRADTEEELLKKCAEHAQTAHGMKEVPKEALAMVKSLIRTE